MLDRNIDSMKKYKIILGWLVLVITVLLAILISKIRIENPELTEMQIFLKCKYFFFGQIFCGVIYIFSLKKNKKSTKIKKEKLLEESIQSLKYYDKEYERNLLLSDMEKYLFVHTNLDVEKIIDFKENFKIKK